MATVKNKFSLVKTKHPAAGFSLIEILIVAGLMGIVSLGVISISKIGLMGQKSIQAQDDARLITDNIAALLTNPAACINTLGGLDPTVGTAFSNVNDQAGTTQYTTGKNYGNKSLTLVGMKIGGSVIDAKSKTQEWVQTGANTGTAFLSIHWTQTGTVANGVTGPMDLWRFALVNATINGSNKITACTAVVANVSSSGTGVANYIPIWTTSINLGNSALYQNGANVGIGTNAPVANLSVTGSTGLNLLSTAGSPEGGRVTWNGDGTGWKLFFQVRNGSSGALYGPPVMTLVDTGNVGIGTTTPGATLDVQGGIRAGASTVVTAGCGMGAANHEGTQRYNYTTHNMEFCNGSAWTPVGSSGSSAGISMAGATSSVPDVVIPVGIISNTLLPYNPGTSAFAAPSDGNYIFTAYTGACTGPYYGVSAAKFFVNGNQIGWEYNASNCNTGAFTTFYYMHAGDSVQGTCSQNVGQTTMCYFAVMKL